ncbi:hypothetical protein B0H13DRAFT_1869286 [Mycena leptocephala]|nr:hypothetical protein B0H13DRAFT_1869286 [Mycena leptocephala]
MIAPRDDSNAFPITAAQLTGHYFETLGYGMYLVTCCFCAQTLFWIPQPGGGERLRRKSEIRWLLVSVFCFIFVSFDQIANMIVGDFVLIYRCFIVYGRRWLAIAVSFTLYLAGIAMAVKLMQVEITTSNAAITINSNVIKPWWSAFFAITAAQNVLTTSLLVWRIWRIEHQSEKFRGRSTAVRSCKPTRLRKVIRVVAESGLAYSTLVFLTFALQATGITFNVIIIRSTPRRDDEFTDFDQTERGIAAQAEGRGAGRSLGGLQFVSYATTDQRKTTENLNINVTIKSTTRTDRLDNGEWQVDTYSMKDVATKMDIPAKPVLFSQMFQWIETSFITSSFCSSVTCPRARRLEPARRLNPVARSANQCDSRACVRLDYCTPASRPGSKGHQTV